MCTRTLQPTIVCRIISSLVYVYFHDGGTSKIDVELLPTLTCMLTHFLLATPTLFA